MNGAGGRIRTPDLLITNQLLYQLSYTSEQNGAGYSREAGRAATQLSYTSEQNERGEYTLTPLSCPIIIA